MSTRPLSTVRSGANGRWRDVGERATVCLATGAEPFPFRNRRETHAVRMRGIFAPIAKEKYLLALISITHQASCVVRLMHKSLKVLPEVLRRVNDQVLVLQDLALHVSAPLSTNRTSVLLPQPSHHTPSMEGVPARKDTRRHWAAPPTTGAAGEGVIVVRIAKIDALHAHRADFASLGRIVMVTGARFDRRCKIFGLE
eukprot:scaffold5046_cov403-Prasinococcus_capsulatus_cf.AAC.3